ncbi:MAG TPA: hypothetical protein VLR93_04870 [Patescibacteria group bacterium]|nr:hypothetical protein [Patescibacteria group bacterium]
MNQTDRLERDLTAWLVDTAVPRTPDYTNDILRQTARMRQRPRWSFLERWLPMSVITLGRRTLKPVPWRAIGLVALLALLVLVALAAYIGSRHRTPAPFGVAGNGLVAYDGAGDIYAKDLASGRIVTIAAGPDFDTAPQFSPDGTKVAFLRRVVDDPYNPGDAFNIVTAEIGGSHATVITTEPIRAEDAAQWAPDGASILANSSRHGDLRLYDATKAAPPRIIASGVVVEAGAFRPPDGKQILFHRQGPDGKGLYVMNLDGTGVTPLVVIDAAHDRDDDSLNAPAWSPDGSTVAFPLTIERAPDQVRIHLVDADGTNLRELSNAPDKVYENGPMWSPDGTRIAYRRWTREPGPDQGHILPVAISGLNGGPLVETGLQLGGSGVGFNWSPDGSTILAVSGDVSRPTLLDPSGVGYADLDVPSEPGAQLSWQRIAR